MRRDFLLAFGIGLGLATGPVSGDDAADEARFNELNALQWSEQFEDSGSNDWTEKWFLDGLRATVRNTEDGMHISSGPIEYDHASHCVLWTQDSFAGDVRIDYDYWRMDTINKHVNILYIQATGIGEGAYHKDIRQWAHLREIPYMRTYYNYMNLLHISYAAYPMAGSDEDYIRARRYPIRPDLGFDDIDLPPDSFQTDLFKPGVKNHITVIRAGDELHMRVQNAEKTMHFAWDTSAFPPITEGRIGLRQMWTRSARYADFTISTHNP